jgi:hypothetical protein
MYAKCGALQTAMMLLELGRYDSGLYVLLSNMHSESQRWDDMKNIRKILDQNGWCYQFMVDDKRHGASTSIYSMLDQLLDHLKSVGLGHPCKHPV